MTSERRRLARIIDDVRNQKPGCSQERRARESVMAKTIDLLIKTCPAKKNASGTIG